MQYANNNQRYQTQTQYAQDYYSDFSTTYNQPNQLQIQYNTYSQQPQQQITQTKTQYPIASSCALQPQQHHYNQQSCYAQDFNNQKYTVNRPFFCI